MLQRITGFEIESRTEYSPYSVLLTNRSVLHLFIFVISRTETMLAGSWKMNVFLLMKSSSMRIIGIVNMEYDVFRLHTDPLPKHLKMASDVK